MAALGLTALYGAPDDKEKNNAGSDSPSNQSSKPKRPRSEVFTEREGGRLVTHIVIDLQNAPDNMEPADEPRRIQVEDRGNVRLDLRNLSPLDVCSLNGRAPAPTAETNVAESVVGTIANLGSLGLGGGPLLAQLNNAMSLIEKSDTSEASGKNNCNVTSDPEHITFERIRSEFEAMAKNFVGNAQEMAACKKSDLKEPKDFPDDPAKETQPPPTQALTQARLLCQLDAASNQLADFAARDFRGANWRDFNLKNPDLEKVKLWFTNPIPTVVGAGKLQALVDELGTYSTDLHKRFDFQTSGGDSAGAAPPAVGPVNGTPIVLAAPLTLTFTYPADKTAPPAQTIRVTSGGAQAGFTVNKSPESWLSVSPECTAATPCQTANAGTFNLSVTVDPKKLGSDSTASASIRIAGAGGAAGSTIVNISVKPGLGPVPTPCDLETLRDIDRKLDKAKALMALITSNNSALQTAQTALKTAYMTVAKADDDFQRRKNQRIVQEAGGFLVQSFNLATDRKATVTENLACVSSLDKTPTTNAINFSILYQDVPKWSASAGLLTSFQQKRIIGVDQESGDNNTPVSFFRVTDQARAQVLPMAFVNYRITPYTFRYRKGGKEDTFVWTGHLSAGIGVNSNNGANQPEFFLGLAVAVNRFMIHPGVHFGRMQSLGGGFTLNTPAPDGVTPPINWSYHPAFSIGFSVRVAPY